MGEFAGHKEGGQGICHGEGDGGVVRGRKRERRKGTCADKEKKKNMLLGEGGSNMFNA